MGKFETHSTTSEGLIAPARTEKCTPSTEDRRRTSEFGVLCFRGVNGSMFEGGREALGENDGE
jgi:hypothetical protein